LSFNLPPLPHSVDPPRKYSVFPTEAAASSALYSYEPASDTWRKLTSLGGPLGSIYPPPIA
jgi:hypothetical protein